MFYGAGFVHRVIKMVEQKRTLPKLLLLQVFYIVLSRSFNIEGPYLIYKKGANDLPACLWRV